MQRRLRVSRMGVWMLCILGITASAYALPDLVVTSLTDPPPTPCQKGVGISMSVTIRNSGSTSTTQGYISCDWYLSTDQTWSTNDYKVGDQQVYSGYLSSGQSYTFSAIPTDLVALDAVPNGFYYVIAYVDQPNLEQESNENNNWRSTTGRTEVTGGAVRDPNPIITTHTLTRSREYPNIWCEAYLVLRNESNGGPAAQGCLTISYPWLTLVSDTQHIRIRSYTTGLNVHAYRPGSTLYRRGGGTIISQYWMVEGNWPSTWPPGDNKEMRIQVKYPSVGTYHVYMRGSMQHSTNTGNWIGTPLTGPVDQQGWNNYDHTLIISGVEEESNDKEVLTNKFELRTLSNPASVPFFVLRMPGAEKVTFSLYNASGQKVEEQMKFLAAGTHRFSWSRKLPPGVYFLQAKAGAKTSLVRAVVIR